MFAGEPVQPWRFTTTQLWKGWIFPYVVVGKHVCIYTLYVYVCVYIYIYLFMHICISHSIFCSKGVGDLIPYEDKWWSNVRVGATYWKRLRHGDLSRQSCIISKLLKTLLRHSCILETLLRHWGLCGPCLGVRICFCCHYQAIFFCQHLRWGERREQRQETRCTPRTRMLTPMLMVQMPKHMDMQICSHAEHFSETVYLNSLVHFSPVTIPVNRKLWNMEEGGVLRVGCGVQSLECKVWSVKCGVSSVKCKVWSVECGL